MSPLAPLPTEPAALRRLLGDLERRYEIGQQSGRGDVQAGWLRNRIAEVRRVLAEISAGEADVVLASTAGMSAAASSVDPTASSRAGEARSVGGRS